jgi:hypothetical protein
LKVCSREWRLGLSGAEALASGLTKLVTSHLIFVTIFARLFSGGFYFTSSTLRGGSAFYLKMVVQFNWNRH